jgi:hypothetical protein
MIKPAFDPPLAHVEPLRSRVGNGGSLWAKTRVCPSGSRCLLGVDAVEKCRGVALSLEQAADVSDVGLERNGPLQAVINSGHRKVAPLLA